MSNISLFFYEWKHFLRSPFKVVATILFVSAGIYGLHNGANLYKSQLLSIEKINKTIAEDRAKYDAHYAEGKKNPENRPWIDLTTPFWAVWYNGIYHFKTPAPAQVYSIGQAEQFGFYKRITFWASPYDADMIKEIANPERLQTGTLDFGFVLLFLLPLLLLILVYNLKSQETEQDILPLIEIQTTSEVWLIRRMLFYPCLLFLMVLGLLFYGAMLTGVFSLQPSAFFQMLFYSGMYLAFWSVLYYLILKRGRSVLGNTLKIVGIWLLFAFIVPASVHQWVSIKKPVNLMTDYIDAKRDKRQALFNLPDSVYQEKLHVLFPEILNTELVKDSTRKKLAYSYSASALVNELMKTSISGVESDNQEKNKLIRNCNFFNPYTFFQNQLNRISQTHFDDYQNYRDQIQQLIDRQIRIMVLDTWNEVEVNQEKYRSYHKELTSIESTSTIK